jgi:hypothetical protein
MPFVSAAKKDSSAEKISIQDILSALNVKGIVIRMEPIHPG